MSSRGRLSAQFVQMVGQQLQGTAGSEIRRRRLAWNEPGARLMRLRERQRRWLFLLLAIFAIFAVLSVSVVLNAGTVQPSTLIWPPVIALGSGIFAVRSAGKLNQTRKRLRAAPPRLIGLQLAARERLPPAGSSAREPMQRLRDSEVSFAELIKQMWSEDGSGPVPQDAVREAAATADQAAAAVRKLADQLRAVEGARNAAPSAERAQLAEAVQELRKRLDDGVEGYGGLVAAAGRTVAASSSSTAQEALTDATDHLAGLALGLRELSERDKLTEP
jgi:hypothetical protein